MILKYYRNMFEKVLFTLFLYDSTNTIKSLPKKNVIKSFMQKHIYIQKETSTKIYTP